MGRPSNLTEAQWKELGERLRRGELAVDLAREYGTSKSAISKRFSKLTETVSKAAQQLAAAQEAVSSLEIPEQIEVYALAKELREISRHLAGSAKFGAATAHRLAGIAHAKVQEIDDAAPLDKKSIEALKGVAVLTKLANEASQIGLNLLSANRDMAKRAAEEEPVLPVQITVQVEDASAPEPAAE